MLLAAFALAPNPAIAHADEELHGALAKMGVAKLAIHGRAAQVVFGEEDASKLCPDVDWKALGQDGFVIRTKGAKIIVAGGTPRGTLNGVHRLLMRFGVRWWTPWAATYPKSNKTLQVGNLNLKEIPAFEYRDPYWHASFDTEWASQNLCNGWNEGLDGKHGGGTVYEGFVHTYYALVDPATQFAKHPEWFSLINGKRTADNAQLCTTNPELRQYVLGQVRAKLRANPKATIISVSQNDCFNQCQCDVCQALAKQEGSQSAPVLALANFVADGIKDEFPNVAVDTLAYQWSRHAPTSMKPRFNVIVRLCSIEGDFGTPLDRGRNQAFADDIRNWSRLTNRLYIWDYVTNFANYIQPMPDYATIGANIRFFAAHGGKGLFEEGDYNSEGGDMAELKCWLQAQLMWDPKQDDRKLTDEFLRGYYGAGPAVFIREYLDLMTKTATESPVSIFDRTDKPYLDYSVMKQAEALWRRAEAATYDPVLLPRIHRSHLGVQYVWLVRWDTFRAAAKQAEDKWPMAETRSEAAQAWLSIAQQKLPDGTPLVTAINEGGIAPEAFTASLKK